MNSVADFLIAILGDFKTFGPANQLMFVVFALGVLLGPVGWLWRRMKSQQKELIGMEMTLTRKIEETQARIAELTTENESLRQFDPATVAHRFAEERRDHNRKRLIAEALSEVDFSALSGEANGGGAH